MAAPINKIGSDHLWHAKNNQDYFLVIEPENQEGLGLKMILDGCGSGENSEVGAKLFVQLFNQYYKNSICIDRFEAQANFVMGKLMKISKDIRFLADNLFFTIVCVFELEDKFIAKICGDGYLIAQDLNENIEYIPLEDGEYPKYLLYNFLPENNRGIYKDGVNFETIEFLKSEFVNIGVATDGLRYIENLPDVEKYKLNDFIRNGKSGKIKMLINRNAEKFKDDITICI